MSSEISTSVEVISGLKRSIKVAITAEGMQSEYGKKLREYKKGVKISGFRPGKVPEQVIEKRYGKSIQQEVRDQMLRTTLTTAIEENKLKIVGMPDLTPSDWTKGEAFEFSADCEVYPEIELQGVEAIKASRYDVEIIDADIDEMLGNLSDQRKTWATVERAAADGDKVIIDFVGTINGEAFAGGTAEDFEVVIGAKHMIPGFEEGLVGIEKGVSRELRLMFPADYHGKDVAGQSAEFAVTAKGIEEATRPEMTDELAKEFGFPSLDKLKGMISDRLEKEASNALRDSQKESILDQLMDANEVELPTGLIKTEVEYLQQAAKQQAVSNNEMDQKAAEEAVFPAEDYQEQAQRRVKLGLILSALVNQFEIKLDHVAVRQRVEQVAAGYPKPAELIEWLYADRSRLAEIETAVLEDQTIEKILEELHTDPKAISYQAAIKQVKDAASVQEEQEQE